MVVPRGRPRRRVPPIVIGVCWKWVVVATATSAGPACPTPIGPRSRSPCGCRRRRDGVTVVTRRPARAPTRGLREALAAGADPGRADRRADRPRRATPSPGARRRACAGVDVGACAATPRPIEAAGRSRRSSPPSSASAQALGLVDVDRRSDGSLGVVRRLDGGRREVLAVTAPAVLSVEGSVARLRRASLPAELAARTAPIEVVPGPTGPRRARRQVAPYRPRPRASCRPRRASRSIRVLQLTDADHADLRHPRAAHPGARGGGGAHPGRPARVGLRPPGAQPFQLSVRPDPWVITVPSISRSTCGVRRRMPNASACGSGHIGMIAGS